MPPSIAPSASGDTSAGVTDATNPSTSVSTVGNSALLVFRRAWSIADQLRDVANVRLEDLGIDVAFMPKIEHRGYSYVLE